MKTTKSAWPGFAWVDFARSGACLAGLADPAQGSLQRGVLAIGPSGPCARIGAVANDIGGIAFKEAALEDLSVESWRRLSAVCIVLASRANGVAISEICRLSAMPGAPPIINLVDDCSVDYAVEAMAMGAYSVLESNADDAAVRAEIANALADDQASRELRMSVAEWQERSQHLTEAERYVLAADWDGRLPDTTACELRIDVAAVQELTARTYQKLGVRSRAESVRMLARESASRLAQARTLH